MRIIYPYNEILPEKKAHDLYIVHECAALADLGWDITLLIGKGRESRSLYSHYQISPSAHLHIKPLFMIRKNNPFNLSWNFPFFVQCQRTMQRERPDVVLLSVRKQGAFHLSRKLPGVRYVYEVHELSSYPHQPPPSTQEFHSEKEMLERADLITVTTSSLKEILLAPPYSLTVPIAVVPLAVRATPLPPPSAASPLVVMYVGQLYEGQGVPTLLRALQQVKNVHLKIIGGKPQEIAHLTHLAQTLGIAHAVTFLGFTLPGQIPALVKEAHAFVAPFENTGRMPYVAHTKIHEYIEWGRPVIAPRLPIVAEHFPNGGALLFEPDSTTALAECMTLLQQKPIRQKLQAEISSPSGRFSWQTRAQSYATLLSP